MKTKPALLIGAALLTVVLSCKKDVTCECSSTTTSTMIDSKGQTTTNISAPSKSTIVYKEADKSDLKTVCGDVTFSDEELVVSASGTTSYKYITNKDCEIK